MDITAGQMLRGSEEQLAEGQGLTHLGSWEWQIPTDTFTWSDELYRIFGLQPQQFGATFEAFLALVHPDDREMIRKGVERAYHEGSPFNFEYRIVPPDGTASWLHGLGMVVHDEAGMPVKLLGTVQDITERKRAEDVLRLQSAILNNVAEGVCLVRVSDAVIVYANPKFEQMFGYDPGQLNGNPVTVVNYGGEDKSPEETARDIIDLLTKHGQATYEVQNVKKDGTPFWCQAHTSTFDHPEYGKVWVAVHQDITARKEAEEERIREQAARAEAEAARERIINILGSIAEAFLTLDKRWCLTYLNQNAMPVLRRLTARKGEDLIGKNIWQEFPEAVGTKLYAESQRAAAEQVPVHFEEFDPPLNVWFEVHIYPSEEGLSVFFRDITQRKQAEEALQQSQEQLRFAMEGAQVGTWDWNILTDEVRWSGNMEAIHGLPRGAFRGTFESFKEGIHPEDAERVLQAIEHAVKEAAEYYVEYRTTWPDGTSHWLEGRGQVWRGQHGTAVRMSGVCMDVTERKRAEEAEQRLAEEHKVLAEIGRIITSSLDIGEVYDRFAEQVNKLIPFDRISIALADFERGLLIHLYSRGLAVPGMQEGAVHPLAGGLVEAELRAGSPVILGRSVATGLVGQCPRLEPILSAGLRSLMVVPLISKGKPIGVLALHSTRDEAYSEKEASLGERIGAQIAGAVANAQLHAQERQAEQTIRELSTPVLQIQEQLLLLPLIGVVYPERARQLTDQLLTAIRAHRARAVVIDITGVVSMDSMVAGHLVKTVESARLLGARVIVTGVSTEIAQTLVRMGVHLSQINTVGDLQSGIDQAQRLLGYKIRPAR